MAAVSTDGANRHMAQSDPSIGDKFYSERDPLIYYSATP
jgi:hypothetical protein